MKKSVFAAAALAAVMCSSTALAAEQNVTRQNLDAGIYDVTAEISADKTGAYLYGLGTDYTKGSTAIPKTTGTNTVVTVRGVRHGGGEFETGIVTEGDEKVTLSGNIKVEKTDKTYNFIQGGDLTEISYIESLGGKYYDRDGNEGKPEEILAESGMNMARIRLSNNPGKGRGDGNYYLPDGYQNLEDCLELSRRAKAAGMGIQFTFNYSDYWSNGERQIIPYDWVEEIKKELGFDIKDAEFLNSMTAEQKTLIQQKLGDIIYRYTFEVMTKLKEQGTVPEYVSLGNEINGGMFFPFGNTYDANMNKDRFELVWNDNKDEENDIKCYKDWNGLAMMLNRGYDAVKAVSPESKVIIHLANGSKDSVFTWFFDEYIKAGGKFDTIGASYYPAWSNNTVQTCVEFCNNISAKYDKDILIMETGYNWNSTKKNGYAGQLADIDAYKDIYPPTLEGHSGFMAELINGLKSVDGGRCLGFLYWDPCMIHVEDRENPNESLSGWAVREKDDKPDGNVVENTTLFDFDGKAIKTLDIFSLSQNSLPKSLNKDFTVALFGKNDKNVYCTLKNTSGEQKKVTAYLGVYDKDGKLIDVKISEKQIEANTASDVSLDIDNNGGIQRFYMWNGEIPIIKAQ